MLKWKQVFYARESDWMTSKPGSSVYDDNNESTPMKASFEILERYANITIIHHRRADGDLWASAGRKILLGQAGEWRTVTEFPRRYPRDLLALTRPGARALRADKCNLYENRLGSVLAIRAGQVYALEDGRLRPLFTIRGDSVLHRSICEDEAGVIYFGEYSMNPERLPVRVWRVVPDLSGWELAAELKDARHVHGVFRDPFEAATLWVTVGDGPGECRLLCAREGFRTIEAFGEGSQIWRAVNLFFTETHVAWITDSPLELNHACRIRRADGSLEVGQAVDCPAWYGCTTVEGLHLAFTTVEQGAAVLNNESSVLVSRDAFTWEKAYAFRKDFWKPLKLFKYGVIAPPSGELSAEEIYLSGEGLVGLDGTSLKARVEMRGASNA